MDAVETTLRPAWTLDDTSGKSLWFNSCDVDSHGVILTTGTFKFDTRTDFTFFVLDRKGTPLLKDVWSGADMGIFWTAVSRDGRYAGAGGWLHSGSDVGYVGLCKLFQVKGGRPLVVQETGSRVNHITFTPTGTLAAACCGQVYGDEGQQVYLWRLGADGTYQALEGYTEAGQGALCASFSEDGRWLAVALIGPTHLILFKVGDAGLQEVRRWSIPQTEHVSTGPASTFRAEHHQAEKTSAKYSGPYAKSVSMAPDGSRFALAASGANGCYLFDVDTFIATGAPRWGKAPDNTGTTSCVTLDRSGTWLVAAGNAKKGGGLIYRLDDADGEAVVTWSRIPTIYGANPTNRLLDEAGTFMAFGSGQPNDDNTLSPGFWTVASAATGDTLAQMGTDVMNWPFQLSGDGSFALGGSDASMACGFEAKGNWR